MKITKAMILAAGLGTRLRPLTFRTPKPLLPIGGRPMLDHNLELLKKAGVKEVVINLHHLGSQIKRHVGSGRRYGLKVRYTNEPKILGTGGGIKNAERYLKRAPFIVMNGDVLVDIDLKKVVLRHFKKGGVATMVLRRLRPGEDYSRVDIDKRGALKGFGRGRYMFTGIQVIEPEMFQLLKKPSCLIKEGYKKALKKGLPVFSYVHNGYWNDIGTFERYYLGIMFKKR